MANNASARKRARQNDKLRAHNASRRSLLRSSIRKVLRAIEARDKAAAQAAFREAEPIIDRMATHGIIHGNTAARQKHRLVASLKALQ